MNLKKAVGGQCHFILMCRAALVGANSFARNLLSGRINSPLPLLRIKHLLVASLLTALPASGAEFTVLHPQQSSITFVSKQMGVPVEGSFKKFTARIAVDPARPETGTARIDIDLASIDTGSVKQPVKGRYETTGKMTIKGKTLDIRAPFTLKQNADMLVIDGMLPLKRL